MAGAEVSIEQCFADGVPGPIWIVSPEPVGDYSVTCGVLLLGTRIPAKWVGAQAPENVIFKQLVCSKQ